MYYVKFLLKYESVKNKFLQQLWNAGMRRMRGTRGMFTRIPGNVIILTFRGMLKKILGNVEEDSGECSKRFRGIFEKMLGNVSKDSGECWQRFSRMLKRIERFIMQLNENRIKR